MDAGSGLGAGAEGRARVVRAEESPRPLDDFDALALFVAFLAFALVEVFFEVGFLAGGLPLSDTSNVRPGDKRSGHT